MTITATALDLVSVIDAEILQLTEQLERLQAARAVLDSGYKYAPEPVATQGKQRKPRSRKQEQHVSAETRKRIPQAEREQAILALFEEIPEMTTSEVGVGIGVSPAYTRKILNDMRKRNLVDETPTGSNTPAIWRKTARRRG